MAIKIRSLPRVGQKNQLQAYKELEDCLLQLKHCETLVHEFTFKLDEMKNRLATAQNKLREYQDKETELRSNIKTAVSKDRNEAMVALKQMQDEMKALEASLEA